MTCSIQPEMNPDGDRRVASATDQLAVPVTRLKSKDLFRKMREVEIEHEGRIYKLRLTQLNKLILTA